MNLTIALVLIIFIAWTAYSHHRSLNVTNIKIYRNKEAERKIGVHTDSVFHFPGHPKPYANRDIDLMVL
jgi:hypothetical protein